MSSLNNQIGSILDSMRLFGGGNLSDVSVEAARANIELLAQMQRNAPVRLYRVEDAFVDRAGMPLPVRIYWPEKPEQCSGVTVFYHGGGFVVGSIDSHDQVARSLAYFSKSVVVSVGYRLAPEFRFPAAVEDAFDSLAWVAQQRKELCSSESKPLCVAGDSAGGNLAAVISQLSRHGGPEITLSLLAYPVVDGVNFANYPSYYMYQEGYFLTAKDISWFGELCLDDPTQAYDPRFSPIMADSLKYLPKTLVIVAGFDPLRDQGVAYYEALRAAGVSAELWRCESMIHGFLSMAELVAEAKQILQRCGEYIKMTFLDKSLSG